ncbi:hypothetical protein KAR91_30520 [Candidatus Pacearchaeota archaeon]|nr:hypothetical protein [Candidatus Pacearchaeota archaeon]
MKKYRKKPVVVEAVQWFPGVEHPRIHYKCWMNDVTYVPPYVITIHNDKIELAPGDWIVTEPDGKHAYPCKPDIFAATYEEVEAQDDPKK